MSRRTTALFTAACLLSASCFGNSAHAQARPSGGEWLGTVDCADRTSRTFQLTLYDLGVPGTLVIYPGGATAGVGVAEIRHQPLPQYEEIVVSSWWTGTAAARPTALTGRFDWQGNLSGQVYGIPGCVNFRANLDRTPRTVDQWHEARRNPPAYRKALVERAKAYDQRRIAEAQQPSGPGLGTALFALGTVIALGYGILSGDKPSPDTSGGGNRFDPDRARQGGDLPGSASSSDGNRGLFGTEHCVGPCLGSERSR